jgi:hypothetical protein
VLVGEVADHVEDLDLVAEVEEGGGLVEEQQGGVLGEAAREPDPLRLPAGQCLHRPLGDRAETGERHGSIDRLGSLRVAAAPAGAVRVAAELDQLAHAQAARCRPLL